MSPDMEQILSSVIANRQTELETRAELDKIGIERDLRLMARTAYAAGLADGFDKAREEKPTLCLVRPEPPEAA